MLEKMSRRNRSLLSLSLTSLALTLSVSAFCTSYWCEGTHKVVKPLCLSPVKMKNCGQNNSQPYTTGEAGNKHGQLLLAPLAFSGGPVWRVLPRPASRGRVPPYSWCQLTFLCVPRPRGPHPGPKELGVQRHAVPDAERGAGQDEEKTAGQRRPVHLGDGRGQVHAALLPHRLLALLREAQRRFGPAVSPYL